MPVLMMSAGGLVLVAAIWDVFSRRIPNMLPLIIAALYLLQASIAGDWSSLPWHLLCGMGVLVVGIMIFALGWLGGGDVKLLAALALWAGPDHLVLLLLMTCLAGGILALIYVLPVILSRNPAVSGVIDWFFMKVLKKPAPLLQTGKALGLQLPYGVAIAAAGFVVFYQFFKVM
ncbi:prepilin peptidase [Sneathiella sp. CAU 1612]|uniref:Prepilin peptidase n=1 Tax=Sneathiella sedimenti TaxID=2816034 RepID=A0ABS3F3D4_9PROT|nr:prepilin peptidase [Sneathiella sedimenti]MBO0332919.1 prepilin peptidase [Sneathiella sedimenti]